MGVSLASSAPKRALKNEVIENVVEEVRVRESVGSTGPFSSMRHWNGVKSGVYYLVQHMHQFEEFYKEFKKQTVIAVDTETSGFSWVHDQACGIVIGWGVKHNFYLPIAHTTGESQLDLELIRDKLSAVLLDENVTKYFWNAKFDLHFLRKAGLEVKGPVHDGVVLVHLLDENVEKALKSVSKARIDPNADQWETWLHQWRKGESSRRRKAYAQLVMDYLKTHRADVEDKVLPLAKFSKLTKLQITAKLKKYVRDSVYPDHPLVKNKKDDITYDQIPLEVITPYACADTHYTFMIVKDLSLIVAKHDDLRHLYCNEMELSDLLFDAESHGLKVDVPYLNRIEPELRESIAQLEKEIHEEVGEPFQIDSPSQLAAALLKVGCQLTKLTNKGQEIRKAGGVLEPKHHSTDRDTLDELAAQFEFAAKVVKYREAMKMLNTYVLNIRDMVDENRYLHSTFNANVSTGRMSSREPNLQNIPGRDKAIRKAFTIPEEVGKEGEDLSSTPWGYAFFDYSQVELRLTAHWSQDPALIAAYPWDGPAKDVHSITCAEAVMDMSLDEFLAVYDNEDDPMFPEYKWFRNIAKRVNFGIIYGAGPGAIQRQVSTPQRVVTKDECELYINKYFNKYKGVKRWIDTTTKTLSKHGRLQNTFGRFRRLPDGKSREGWKRGRAGRQGVNFLIQGDAADLFKHAAVRVQNFLHEEGARTRIVNFVHDEIQFYWHKDEKHLIPEVKKLMEDFPQFSVPIVVDVEWSDRDWAGKKGLKL